MESTSDIRGRSKNKFRAGWLFFTALMRTQQRCTNMQRPMLAVASRVKVQRSSRTAAVDQPEHICLVCQHGRRRPAMEEGFS